jgi:hypothetical protein
MVFTKLLCSVTYALDVLLYTGMCNLMMYLPDSVCALLLPLMFSMNTIGSPERWQCVYLVNYNEPISNMLAFGASPNYVTSSVSEAIEISESLEIPIQPVVCYYSREYFSEGWAYPQPYELVYEYGEIGVKTEKEYNDYFFEKMGSRPSPRLYEQTEEEWRMLLIALLCSRYSMLLVYLLLRYQWYNRVCFQSLLVASVVATLFL